MKISKKKELELILNCYGKYLDKDLKKIILDIYNYDSSNLHQFNTNIIKTICSFLKIKLKQF